MTTTAAAERLRAHEDVLYSGAWRDDALILVNAYLAEHQADDATPLDEEWLRSVGFEGPHFEASKLALFKDRLKITFYNGWNMWLSMPVESSTRLDVLLVEHVKDRGTLRAICRVLEIPLTGEGQ